MRRNHQRIVQCKTCQGFNHVKNNCHKAARCVKCAGHHYTKNCTKDHSTTPKCANCGEGHTANYRGCMVAVELQRLRDKARKGKQGVLNSQRKSVKELQAAQQSRQAEKAKTKVDVTTTKASYANKAAKGTINEEMSQTGQSECYDMASFMARLDHFITSQEKLNDMFMTKYQQTASSRTASKKK